MSRTQAIDWTKWATVIVALPVLGFFAGQGTDIARTPAREHETSQKVSELETNCVLHWQQDDFNFERVNAQFQQLNGKIDELQSTITLKR